MAIRIRRSQTTATPPSLAEGQLAYSENSGNLFVGTSGASVTKIGGQTDVAKLAGVEAGAQVNTVDDVAGKTGNVTLDHNDITDFDAAADGRVAAADIGDLSNVSAAAPSTDQVLTWTGAQWAPQAAGSGVTTFVALNDTPANFASSGGFFVRVNSGENALEYVEDVDDGTF